MQNKATAEGNEGTIAQVTGSQITLKNHSKRQGEGQYVCDLVNMGYKQPNRVCKKFLLVTGAVFTMQDFRALLGMTYKNWAPKTLSPGHIYLKTSSASFSQSTQCFISDLHPQLFRVGAEQQLQHHMICPCRWPVPIQKLTSTINFQMFVRNSDNLEERDS